MKVITKGEFLFRKLTLQDLPMVRLMVRDFFLPRSPLMTIFQVKPQEVDTIYMERIKTMLKGGASAGCFHVSSGEAACLALCSVLTEGSTAHQSVGTLDDGCSPALKSMIRFWNVLEGDLFTTLGAKKIFFKDIGVVRPNYAKSGLFTQLDTYTSFIAQELNCEYVVAELLSAYSQRVVIKNGHIILREISYSDYVDPQTGQKPNLNLSPDHLTAQVAYQKVATAVKSSL